VTEIVALIGVGYTALITHITFTKIIGEINEDSSR
tara:strand:- start:42 stop:146 length:105 start_codon:yes stop_codon:yes gene_type:complete